MSQYNHIRVEIADGVATVTLSRPERSMRSPPQWPASCLGFQRDR